MDHDAVSFANALGEHMAPLLLRVRATGFFDAPIYMSVMTALSIPLFIWLKNRLQGNGTLPAMRPRALWLVADSALRGCCQPSSKRSSVGVQRWLDFRSVSELTCRCRQYPPSVLED